VNPLRAAIATGDEDLAVMVSDHLHAYVIAEGVPGLAATDFRRHLVVVKTFQATDGSGALLSREPEVNSVLANGFTRGHTADTVVCATAG
jgi:hypothetical protein